MTQPIDPKSVPRTSIDWPAAYRLRPASIPHKGKDHLFGETFDGLGDLIDMLSPKERHEAGVMEIPSIQGQHLPESVKTAFSNPAPEWRFVPSGLPHLAVSPTVNAAVLLASETYGQFMKDTAQGPGDISFVVERYRVRATVADITDAEVFAPCYDETNREVVHSLVQALAGGTSGPDGIMFERTGSCGLVLFNPACVSSGANERAIALKWDGENFTGYFDYRDLYEVQLTG